MLIVTGTVRIPPERTEAARPVMTAMVTASRAEAGCLAYSYAVDVIDPGLVHVVERWEDEASLSAHFQTDHMATWRAHWGEFGITDRQLACYTVGDERSI